MATTEDATTTTNGGTKNGDAEAAAASPATKRAKTDVPLTDVLSSDILQRETELTKSYKEAKPYPHCVLENVFQPEFLRTVQKEIKDNSKVNFKESDLFKMYQSIDMANLSDEASPGKDMPAVMQLRKVLYSDEWRSYIERVCGLEEGTLSSQEVDCACNCHSNGGHLLCHDDVIGTRKISYIIYLTDEPAWEASEGGALELYDSTIDETTKQRIPDSIPCQQALPTFNSMAFFKVEPGYSFHAVQEVCSDRPRLSLQGWYHASEAPSNIQDATLQRLKKKKSNDDPTSSTVDAFEPYKEEEKEKEETKEGEEPQQLLSESDRKYLSEYLDETYLTPEALKEMNECFADESSIQLRHFLQDKWMDQIRTATTKEDEKDTKLEIHHPDFYKQGISECWKLIGPSHMQRYLQYQSENEGDKSKLESAGEILDHLRIHVLQSQPFRRFLSIITGLDDPTGYRGEVRRFCPGRDYTVAHYGLLRDNHVLDATLCFAAGSGGYVPPEVEDPAAVEKLEAEGEDGEDDDEAAAAAAAAEEENGDVDAKKPTPSKSPVKAPPPDDTDVLWSTGDVGGFECYIAADDDDKCADEYNADDDTELLSVSASNNTLSIVYRDPGTMRFVKYLSKQAPSSRWDIAMEYEVPPDDGGDDNEAEEEEEKPL